MAQLPVSGGLRMAGTKQKNPNPALDLLVVAVGASFFIATSGSHMEHNRRRAAEQGG